MAKRSPTTKDIALLLQLYRQGQILLAPEYQRNSVWPTPAKAYLIDTILNDRPIPLLFFQRITSAQAKGPTYSVIDGQQRLRAIFDFIENRFRLTQSDKDKPYYNKRFSQLPKSLQDEIYNYDLTIEELSGYSESDIQNMFVRMNRYVVKLAPQELRHAQYTGKFHEFVEEIGEWDFWRTEKVFTASQIKRMRNVEFAAEVTILILEGPQDKKSAIDLYYQHYQKTFPAGKAVEKDLRKYLSWVKKAVPNLSQSRYRKPVDLYSLIGALVRLLSEGHSLSKIDASQAGDRLHKFEKQLAKHDQAFVGDKAKYWLAASRQTDNIMPRTTRIDVLARLILGTL